MAELVTRLEAQGVGLNSRDDEDGLKHPWLSECTLLRVRRYNPAAVVYVLGEPAAAAHSHFRRGWAASQLCRLARDADAALSDPTLYAIFDLNRKSEPRARPTESATAGATASATSMPIALGRLTNAAQSWANFTHWIASASGGRDPFEFAEHALSWQRGATELGVPLWFTTLEDLAADATPLTTLLGLPINASAPLYTLQMRPRSYVPDAVPRGFTDVYARVQAELEPLRGLCYDPPLPAARAAAASAAPPWDLGWAGSTMHSVLGSSRTDSPCAAAGLHPAHGPASSGQSVFAGEGTGAVGNDSLYRFFGQTQVRQASRCWLFMRPRGARRPELVASPSPRPVDVTPQRDMQRPPSAEAVLLRESLGMPVIPPPNVM